MKRRNLPAEALHLPDIGGDFGCAGGRPAQRGNHGQRAAAVPHPVGEQQAAVRGAAAGRSRLAGRSTYEAYCEKMAQSSHADTARNSYKSTGSELPQITIRPALAKDFPTLLQICKDRCQFDATRAGVDKSHVPTFESRLETLTQSLVTWISAGQCFLMEPTAAPAPGSSCSCPRRTTIPPPTNEKAARRQRPPRRCPAPPCWALIQAPVLQVLPSICSPSVKPAARGWQSKSRWTTRSAGSAWPTGWTRGLCRIHGRLPAGRYGLSHPQTDDSFFRSDVSIMPASPDSPLLFMVYAQTPGIQRRQALVVRKIRRERPPDAACGRLCAVHYRVLQHSKCTGGQDVRLVVTLFPAGSG